MICKTEKSMNGKSFCLAVCALVFALCLSVEAQQAEKILRMGYVSANRRAIDSQFEEIRAALSELGYTEEQILPLSTDMRRESAIRLLSWQTSW